MNISKIKLVGSGLLILSLLLGCASNSASQTSDAMPQRDAQEVLAQMSDEDIENLVRRSYQYVAMYNVIQKFAECKTQSKLPRSPFHFLEMHSD